MCEAYPKQLETEEAWCTKKLEETGDVNYFLFWDSLGFFCTYNFCRKPYSRGWGYKPFHLKGNSKVTHISLTGSISRYSSFNFVPNTPVHRKVLLSFLHICSSDVLLHAGIVWKCHTLAFCGKKYIWNCFLYKVLIINKFNYFNTGKC